MTTDVLLFILIGGAAIAAAVMMLLSENAVHSALFLIVNFACVAFLYLMLEAPFLAIVQIAVYAGAIMVLFLFVIMLLGAENLGKPTKEFKWLAPLALALATGFLLITGVAVIQGQIDLQPPAAVQPLLRVVHAASDAGAVDVYVNGEQVAENVLFGQATDYLPLAAGEYTISLNRAGTDTALLTAPPLTLESATEKQVNAFTALAYGTGSAPSVALLEDNLETTEARTGRVRIFNAFTGPVDLVDFRSDFNPDDDVLVIEALEPGASFDLPAVPENTPLRAYAFTLPGRKDRESILFRLNTPEVFNIARDTSQLVVLAAERVIDDALRAVALPFVSRTVSSFGGPHALGELLFTRYMLPMQMVAILLLVGMIGAIVLTHKDDFQPRRRDVRRKVSKPLTQAISAQIGQDVLQPPTEAPRLPRETEEEPEAVGD
jgi:NADH:ubiquinone oxidoreductase subunit 6 (subunit J)